jgi:hypothetical protein
MSRSFRRTYLGLAFLLAATVPALAQCGMADCPLGFTNLFCRKIDDFAIKVRGESVSGMKHETRVCLVNSGGAVFVAGDLLLFVRIHNVPESISTQMNVDDCAVSFGPAVGGGGNQTFRTGAVHFGPFNSTKSKPEHYQIAPQIVDPLRDLFRSPFDAAVKIKCSATVEVSKRKNAPPILDSELYKELKRMRERGEIQ